MSKTVLITGAGTGFGRGAAVEIARRGHLVIAATYSQVEADELAAAHPELQTVKMDVTNPADVAPAGQWGVDVLISNAGVGQSGPLRSIPMDRLRRVFDVNVFGTVAIVQTVANSMVERGSGRILLVSSVAGVLAGPGTGPYAMTKHALQAFGGALRAELAPAGVDVALINPGPFATGFNDRMAGEPGDWFDPSTARPEELAFMARVTQRITIGQLDPADVVKVYADLVDAPTTEPVNFIPSDIIERIKAKH